MYENANQGIKPGSGPQAVGGMKKPTTSIGGKPGQQQQQRIGSPQFGNQQQQQQQPLQAGQKSMSQKNLKDGLILTKLLFN
jgi:hypothetical protein